MRIAKREGEKKKKREKKSLSDTRKIIARLLPSRCLEKLGGQNGDCFFLVLCCGLPMNRGGIQEAPSF